MEEIFSKFRKLTELSNPQNPLNLVAPLDIRLKKGEK